MGRFSWLLLTLLACSALPDARSVDSAPAPRLGLWVLAEGEHRTLESPDRTPHLIAEAQKLGATDLFVQVYRRGRSWFPAEHADATPFREIRERSGRDPLRDLIDAAHASRMRVHAWFNVLALHDNPDAPLIRALGRDAVLVDRSGRNLMDYPGWDVPPPDRTYLQLDTPGLWLDPAAPGVIDALEKIVRELASAYPDLDGLHLDFIRHPMGMPMTPGSGFAGLDFGYGDATRKAFEAKSGKPFKRGAAWDDFRRDSVSEVVRRFKAAIPPKWEHSAAVFPWVDRAYLSAMQDWRRWLEEGWLDFGVAMTYTRDDRLLRYQARGLTAGVGGERVWLGLGTWLFPKEPERALAQLRIVEEVKPRGVALFSYDALTSAPELREALARDAR
jgi:uncharacterized lipoprotein YddW (UPF0748 family)